MSPKDKARAAGLSSSSFMDFGAELQKGIQEFDKNKAAGKANAATRGIKKRDNKVAKWAKQNPGVQQRAARDTAAFEQLDRATYEDHRVKLERKAQQYDLLSRGKSGGLTEEQHGECLVDFSQKQDGSYDSDSDDVDESLTVPVAPQYAENDPVIEYKDEYGRDRTARRSQVPLKYLPDAKKDDDDDEFDPYARLNPINHYPTWERSAEDQARIRREAEPESGNVHFDWSKEIRAKSGLTYGLSQVSDVRQQELQGLKDSHEETNVARAESGAQDVLPGEIVGMRADQAVPGKGRGAKKRERVLEERNKLLEARKRKKNGQDGEKERERLSSAADVHIPPPPSVAATDPFASLEAQAASQKRRSTGKGQPSASSNTADAFLAQLEQDMYNR